MFLIDVKTPHHSTFHPSSYEAAAQSQGRFILRVPFFCVLLFAIEASFGAPKKKKQRCVPTHAKLTENDHFVVKLLITVPLNGCKAENYVLLQRKTSKTTGHALWAFWAWALFARQ